MEYYLLGFKYHHIMKYCIWMTDHKDRIYCDGKQAILTFDSQFEVQQYALSKGIIIADTKFEFGLDENGNVVLGDEMLTPDSSRFWPLEGYEAGHGQPSFDKQFVRNWLKANPDSNYDLPQDVIDKTIEKYLEAYEMLTGKKL